MCRALGELQDRGAVPTLIDLLAGWRTASQTAAAQALGQIGDRSAVAALCQTLTEKWNPELRAATVRALEQLGDPAAVPSLIDAMGRPDGGTDHYADRVNRDAPVRAAAAQALGTLVSLEAVDPLVNAVHDSSDRVRLAAVRALGRLGASRSLPHLLAARHDRSCRVVEAATDALIALDPGLLESTLLELFDNPDPSDRANAARGLARLGSVAALARLVAALEEPDREVRMTAAGALGHTGSATVVEPLIRALEDPESLVRREATRGSGRNRRSQSGTPPAGPPGRSGLADPECGHPVVQLRIQREQPHTDFSASE